jgi:hypothetical protein
MMVDDTEESQLKDPIDLLVPYSLLFGAIPAIPRRVTSKPFPARSQRITEDARLLTSWHPEPVSAILVLRGVGILSLHPTPCSQRRVVTRRLQLAAPVLPVRKHFLGHSRAYEPRKSGQTWARDAVVGHAFLLAQLQSGDRVRQ